MLTFINYSVVPIPEYDMLLLALFITFLRLFRFPITGIVFPSPQMLGGGGGDDISQSEALYSTIHFGLLH